MKIIKVGPDGFTLITIEPKDVSLFENLLTRLRDTSDKYLDYDANKVFKHYRKGLNKLLSIIDKKKGTVSAPYDIIYDYRKNSYSSASWGKVTLKGKFEFPLELKKHKELMESKMKKERKLEKGNTPCPRLVRFSLGDNNEPTFFFENAEYFDQVGTNLSLDAQLEDPIEVGDKKCQTVRKWDIIQAGLEVGELPSFENSKLANTLGVAVGFTAKNKYGETVILMRKRKKKVAVYPGMWHLPCSFALSLPSGNEKVETDLRMFINFSFPAELSEEANLIPSDFYLATPIAFCRDLIRGGKPQLFLEMEAKDPFEQLKAKIEDRGKYKEYKNKIKLAKFNSDSNCSPELLAYLMLKL